MNAIGRRIQRLETRLAPQQDPRTWGIANLLYERRRWLAETEGQPFKDLPPERPRDGPRLSIAETLRRRREQLAKPTKEPFAAGGKAGTASDIAE